MPLSHRKLNELRTEWNIRLERIYEGENMMTNDDYRNLAWASWKYIFEKAKSLELFEIAIRMYPAKNASEFTIWKNTMKLSEIISEKSKNKE